MKEKKRERETLAVRGCLGALMYVIDITQVVALNDYDIGIL